MKSINLLARSNLRKNKGQAVSLFFIMLFVALFISIGIAMWVSIVDFLHRRADELNSAHFFAALSNDELREEQIDFISGHELVTDAEIFEAVWGGGEIRVSEAADFQNLIFSPVDASRVMNPPVPTGESLPLEGDAIFVPKYIWMQGGFELGDTLHINFFETDLYFTVAGYIEKYFFGSMMAGFVQFYVSDEMFAYLQSEFDEHANSFILAQVSELSRVGELSTSYLDFMLQHSGSFEVAMLSSLFGDYNMMFGTHTFFTDIAGGIMLFFAIVLLIVSLIIIRFRINNSIDESMVNIGALKAIGYSSRQIISAILIQFGSIAFVGGVVGIAVAQLILPTAIGILGPFFPFTFVPVIDWVAKIILLAVMMACVLLFSLLATRRIHKLFPLVALRGGITTHSFKRNAFPLEKARGPLSLIFALKDVLNNKRQSIAIGLVIAGISFAGAAGLATHYAINVNNGGFLDAIIGEFLDIMVEPADFDYADELGERLRARPEVRGVTEMLNGVRLSMDNEMVVANIASDFAVMGGQSLVRGRMPIHYNEVTVGNGVMRTTGKDIGDWVTVRSGGEYFEFLITGLVSASANGGMVVNMTFDGFTRMQEIDRVALIVFLHDGADHLEFLDTLREEEGDNIAMLASMQEVVDAQMEDMGVIFASITVLILVVMSLIVVATMYLVIKTAILRKRRELGIQKALGFTTLQLMNQISLNLTPAIVVGTVLGAIGGYLSFSSLFVLGMSASGVVQANLPSPFWWTVFMCVGFVVLAYVVSMLVSLRIRKISAYALVTE